MRASRLLFILTTLQAKGRATAQALAEECEVSLRTIYRDMEALSAAGVPVYGERGSDGGYRLLDGYRTRLNGLSREEAESLFLSGLQGPAALLGLGTIMAGAELKLLAALPADLRRSAETVRARFHLDAPAWFDELEQPPVLQDLAAVVWRRSRARMSYRSGDKQVERTIDPLGLVLKGGAWYLVARVESEPRTYRVSRIQSLEVLDETFDPPAAFDLAAYWQANAERFEESLFTLAAKARLSPQGYKHVISFGRARQKAVEQSASEPDADGWRTAMAPIESIREGVGMFLRLGAEAEVLEPAELRDAVMKAVEAMGAIYARRS